MVDIDERVVSMKFDSSDFEKNTKSTMSILDKLHEKLSFKDVADSDSLNAITDNVEKMANKAYTIVDRMIDKIKDNIANKLVNFLQENTLGQFKAGFDKYADMTTSVATLSSQGYEMKRITDQLERLNYFTDETSYNFTSMVSEIGKFTASGQSLEDATTAMMGIAEWAALSGKNANEASRAMYQLSQALGSGTMRLIDYKSIQNLNMDTIEFRKNAIEAAIAAGTLKDNLNGTFTSLIDNKTTFAIQNFAESLSGKWFNSKVMMETYKKYSDAVDEIRAIYEEGTYRVLGGEDQTINTTADAVKLVKENNDILYERFRKANAKLSNDDIDDYLKKWKKVEKVTNMTVKDYAEMHEISEEEAKTMMAAKEKGYAEYLKEYAEVFKETEQSAEDALEDWHTYVSTYGIKAFEAAQEAKTFRDAIESAKDAASTVWTTIYTEVFGNYEEAKELWTDLANALYEIFVNRLWDLEGIFKYWKDGYERDAEKQIKTLKEEYDKLTANGAPADVYGRQRVEEIKKEMAELQAQLDTGLLNGRRVLFQGLYAFGGGLKGALQNFRDAWNELFEENESAKRLFAFSERIRYDGFRFYKMMQELGETEFFTNIAQGIKNLFAPFKGALEVIKAVINSFLPAKQTTKDLLLTLSEAFKNFTEKLVPSQTTLQKIAKILRGVVSVIRLLAKAAYGLWTAIIKPILDVIFGVFGEIFDFVTDILASMADGFYGFENAIGPMEALQIVAEAVKWAFEGLLNVIKTVASALWSIFGPAVNFIIGIFKELIGKAKSLFTGGNGNVLENMANGFKDVTTRAKTAWKSTESFADVFNRFREGKGISNVIELLGALLDNLVTRIGRTVLAIFGLEDVITNENGKIGAAFSDLKGVLANVGTVLKWIYTNVIRPTLQVAFTGLANCIRDIAAAWQSGDVMQIMKILTQAFKTIGSFQLFKVLQALSRTFGSAGILKVLRNAAKSLKSLSKWLGAKAVNEVSSAIFKLVLAFGILLGILTAMSFLPSENLEKVSQMLIYAGIALGVMMIAMTTLSIVATKTRWGLVGIAGSMIAIVAATWTFIFVIEKIREAVQRFKDETEGFGGVLAAIAPIISVLAGMFIVFKAAAKIGNSGGLLAFGAGIMALGVAVFAMTFALDKMVKFMQSNTVEDVLASIAAIIVIMTAISLAAGLMLRIVGNSFVGIRKTSTAIAMALSIVTVALTTALVVIPLLDQMVQNADRFPQYMQALAIFALTMISISASFALMTSRTKGGFHMIAAGFVFNIFANTIKNIILPVLFSLAGINMDDYIGGILTLAALLIAISVGIRQILEGIASIITALSQINWKNWLAIILSTGAVIGGILLLVHFLDDTKSEISVAAVFISIGVVLAIILAFSIFARTILTAVGGNSVAIDALSRVFKWMALLITAIMTGLVAVLVLIKAMYGDEWGTAIATMGLFAGIVLVTLGLTMQIFGAWIKKINTYLATIGSERINKSIGLMIAVFGGIIATMIVLTGIAVLLGSIFDDVEDYVIPVLTMAGATLGLLALGLLAIAAFLKFIPTVTFNKHACIVLIASLASILLTLIIVSTLLLPAFDKYLARADWKPLLALLGGIALIFIAVGALVAMISSSNIGNSFKSVAALFVTLLTIAIMVPLIAKAFSTFENVSFGAVITGLIAVIAPLAALYILTEKFSVGGFGDKFLAAAFKISAAIIMISLALGALALAIAAVIELFNPGSTWLTTGFNLMSGVSEGIDDGKDQVLDSIDEVADGANKEFKRKTDQRSPSKLYRKYGKFIDMGLAQGITRNRRYAIKASANLAILTNQTFCDELGIASPSKVFYENGRFVVRGFLNGMNDETNKNKKAGADMAEGFTEGMDNMMNGMKDKWSGLWTELGMDKDIKNAIENGTEGAGSIFANNLLSELSGEETVVTAQLDAAAAQELSRLKGIQKRRDDAIRELEEHWTGDHGDGFKSARQEVFDAFDKEVGGNLDQKIKDIESKAGKVVKKSGGLTGLLSSVFGDTFTGLGEDTNFLDKLKGFGEKIGDGIGDVFKKDGTGFNSLLETGKNLLSEFGFDLGGEGSNTSGTPADAMGNQLGTGVGNGLNNYLTGKSFGETLNTAGQKIGGAIKDGIESVLTKYNPFANIKMMYDTLIDYIKQNDRKKANEGLPTNVVNQNQETIDRLIEQNKQLEAIKPQNAKEAEAITKQIYENNKAIEKLQDYKVSYGLENEKMFKTLNNILNESEYNWAREIHNVIDDSETNVLHSIFGNDTMKEIFTDWLVGDGYTAQLGRRMKSVVDLGEQFAYYDKDNNLHFTNAGGGILAIEAAYEFGAIDEEKYKQVWQEVAKNDVLGYDTTFIETWNKNHGSILDEYLDLIESVKKESGQKSPSKVWGKIGMYDVEGYMEGFDEVFPHMLNMLVDDTALMNDTAKTGMQAMINSLNEDIQPSITPVFDGFDTKASVGSINSAISGITPSVQATVDSFRDETPNYNSKFDALANNINNTNSLMNTLLSMLEEGDIITVNVNAESDPNNIYELVVNTNREKFKQTGKNKLMSY